VGGQTLGLFPANDAFVAKIKEANQPAVVRPGARVAGPTAGAALTPRLPAPVGGAAPQAFALGSAAALAPPQGGTIAEPPSGSGAPETPTAAWPGSAEGQDAAAPRPQEVGRVPGAAAGYPPDGALPNELVDRALLDWLDGR
jgi:hypothetical protein